MKTIEETKLECVRLASSLAQMKAIEPTEVVAQARRYFEWIRGDDQAPAGVYEIDRGFGRVMK